MPAYFFLLNLGTISGPAVYFFACPGNSELKIQAIKNAAIKLQQLRKRTSIYPLIKYIICDFSVLLPERFSDIFAALHLRHSFKRFSGVPSAFSFIRF